jgi:hypothetical protein
MGTPGPRPRCTAPLPADEALAARYGAWPDRGEPHEGVRLTLLCERTRVAPGEEIRVVHVQEVAPGGPDLFPSGPKPVYGEYLDGALATEPARPGDPFLPVVYDGATDPPPGVDTAFQVTVYRLSAPGTHEIVWAPGPYRSNTLRVEVAAGGPDPPHPHG